MFNLYPLRKRFLFQIEITLQDLESIPFLSGQIFAKVKLVEPFSRFICKTKKFEITNHTAIFNDKIAFRSKFIANRDGYLLPVILRISFRRETLGGKSYDKIGYVNIDLSQHAGSICPSQHYLIQNTDSRSFNSIFCVLIVMKQIEGDSCFKITHNDPLPINYDYNAINSFNINDNISEKKFPALSNNGHISRLSGYSSNDDEYKTEKLSSPHYESKEYPEHILLQPHHTSCYGNTFQNISHFKYDDILTNFASDSVRNKRLSTIDHPSERVSSSRIKAENVVDQLVYEGTHSISTRTFTNLDDRRYALVLDNNGLPTLNNIENLFLS